MKELQEMAEAFARSHPENAARLLELELSSDSAQWLGTLSEQVAAAVIQKMVPLSAAGCLELIDIEFTAKTLSLVEVPLAIGILRRIRGELRPKVMERLPKEFREKVSDFLRFSEDTAAALVDPLVLTISEDFSVQNAETIYRNRSQDAHYYIYVLDREQRLVGVVSLRDLTMNDNDTLISSIMIQGVSSIPADSSKTEVLSHPGWREFHTMPVVDENQKFLGAIRYETLRLLEAGMKTAADVGGAKQAGQAFGELYWLGLSGIFQGIGSSLTKKDPKDEKESDDE